MAKAMENNGIVVGRGIMAGFSMTSPTEDYVGSSYGAHGWWLKNASVRSKEIIRTDIVAVDNPDVVQACGREGVRNFDGSATRLGGLDYYRRTRHQCACIIRNSDGHPTVFCRNRAVAIPDVVDGGPFCEDMCLECFAADEDDEQADAHVVVSYRPGEAQWFRSEDGKGPYGGALQKLCDKTVFVRKCMHFLKAYDRYHIRNLDMEPKTGRVAVAIEELWEEGIVHGGAIPWIPVLLLCTKSTPPSMPTDVTAEQRLARGVDKPWVWDIDDGDDQTTMVEDVDGIMRPRVESLVHSPGREARQEEMQYVN